MKVIYLFLLFSIWVKDSVGKNTVYTQVTYLYDINRGLTGRSFDYYKTHFEKQLKGDNNMIIYGQKQMGQFVWQRRKQHNTVFIQRPLSSFKNYWFAPLIQKVRQSYLAKPNFAYRNYVQYSLQYYNLLMMGKLFVMLQSLKHDKFDSDILIWVDAGYTHIFPDSVNIFDPQNLVRKYFQLLQPQWVLFCYDSPMTVLNGYAEGELRYIHRKLNSKQLVLAGHQGGYAEIVKDMKNAFENFLKITLQYGDMSADEAIVSMMPIKFPYLIPTTTTFNVMQFKDKISIYEDVSRKPTHSRSFGCRFSSNNIQIAFDNAISKSNLLGLSRNNSIKTTHKGIPKKQISSDVEQIFETSLNTKQLKDTSSLIDNIYRTRKQLYLDMLIFIVLLVIYFYLLYTRRSINTKNQVGERKNYSQKKRRGQIIYIPQSD